MRKNKIVRFLVWMSVIIFCIAVVCIVVSGGLKIMQKQQDVGAEDLFNNLKVEGWTEHVGAPLVKNQHRN